MRLRWSATLLLLICGAVTPALASTDQELEAGLQSALKLDPTTKRQDRMVVAIRAYQATGAVSQTPERRGSSEFYAATRSLPFLGNRLIALRHEPSVPPGAGVYVQVTNGSASLKTFARTNECRVEEFSGRNALQAEAGTAGPDDGPYTYAALLCGDRSGAQSAPRASAAAVFATGAQAWVAAGSIVCLYPDAMRMALASEWASNSRAAPPDGCLVVKERAETRIVREFSEIPGVVVIQAGDTAALVRSSNLLAP